jgi:Leucine-rich repeat (LRR) protein
MRQASQRATEATLALAKADSANAKNEKLINAFYFYDGKFAVAFGKDKENYRNVFYFIDKEGNRVERLLGEYKEANNFDYDGWAYVSKEDGKEYLLDTLGNTYRVAYNLSDLSPEIEALDLRNKSQNNFPIQALQYPNLKVLMIDNSYGYKGKIAIPMQINYLRNLTFLKLQNCQIDTLPPNFLELKNLTSLDLFSNQLSTLPAQIGELKNLTELHLSENQLSTFPAQIGELKNLTKLYLSSNQLKELPTQIAELKNLKTLLLNNNPLSITEIDKALQSLPQIESYI